MKEVKLGTEEKMEGTQLIQDGECEYSDNLIFKQRPDELKGKTLIQKIVKKCAF